MTVSRISRRAGSVLAAVVFALAQGASGYAQSPSGSTVAAHTVTLSAATVSLIDETHLVITADAGGDIRGSISLHLEADSDGSWRGNWALVSSYARDLPQGPQQEGGEHHGGIEFVRDGGLTGSLHTIAVERTSNGVITALSGPLTVLTGTIKFEGAAGDGAVSLSTLEDSAASIGRVVLNF